MKQLSIQNFFEKSISIPEDATASPCQCLLHAFSKMKSWVVSYIGSSFVEGKISNPTIAQNVLSEVKCKYQHLKVTGDSLAVRTKFITKVNKSDVHKLTFAQIYVDNSLLEIGSKIEDWASCMHMQAGLIVCADEKHALFFEVKHGYGGKCTICMDVHEPEMDAVCECRTSYVLLARNNF